MEFLSFLDAFEAISKATDIRIVESDEEIVNAKIVAEAKK